MEHNRTHLISDFNDDLDTIRDALYRFLEFDEEDRSEKKHLAKREVLFAINELRIRTELL